MSAGTSLAVETNGENESMESELQKGVKHLCERGITKVPTKYIWPIPDRPNSGNGNSSASNPNLKLPIIDFAKLQGSNRSQAINSLKNACEKFGFFQLVNHDIPKDVIESIIDVSKGFFELPFEERSKYMSTDMRSPVRYGTSSNQNKDDVFCWRDFLKLSCQPLSDVLPLWPSSPVDLRQAVLDYSKNTKFLYLMLTEAILESLGLKDITKKENENDEFREFKDGSQLIVVNCYPACPEPDLTLGLPPHSDYGLLTVLLQDEVQGLQIQYEGRWVTVEPLPDSLVVNIGDHLEIFSNGKYRSLIHRVLVNPSKSRISIASLHSLPFNSVVQPSPKLINEDNPRRYMDTDFASFLDYSSSSESKRKSFLESRKLT
ncbi:protein DMR6-LIKE OXYGENASE 2-like isoform X1 [Quercus lobata]|uniref:Fe2OG dioxygenase domain-containing protein n=1 Tax=Quercus lobata TaxID=97700 RepID=A0A7N2R9Q5_QUELO|nr:protein DMR6-LIKE OXYGENASE 2-like isoform X1 [Quercus lobata]